jgi:hypothetical protein
MKRIFTQAGIYVFLLRGRHKVRLNSHSVSAGSGTNLRIRRAESQVLCECIYVGPDTEIYLGP